MRNLLVACGRRAAFGRVRAVRLRSAASGSVRTAQQLRSFQRHTGRARGRCCRRFRDRCSSNLLTRRRQAVQFVRAGQQTLVVRRVELVQRERQTTLIVGAIVDVQMVHLR